MNESHINIKNEVYSLRGFKETLESPIFYSVIVVAIVLGTASIFGFLQNPLKLKAMATVIHERIVDTEISTKHPNNIKYSITDNLESPEVVLQKPLNVFDEFPSFDQNINKSTIKNDTPIEFNYDVTSENFWSNLDASILDKPTQVIHPRVINRDLELTLPKKLNTLDGSIYAISNF